MEYQNTTKFRLNNEAIIVPETRTLKLRIRFHFQQQRIRAKFLAQ